MFFFSENLANLTDEMKMLEARYTSCQRQISVKDAEILRLQQDLEDERLRRAGEEERRKDIQEKLSNAINEINQFHSTKSELNEKVLSSFRFIHIFVYDDDL